jgi:chemotaxis protein CheX
MTDTRLLLPEVLDSRAAHDLAVQLLEVEGRSVALDASAVRRVGGLCLQVLLAACQGRKNTATLITICDPSAAFREGVMLLGGGTLLESGNP